MSLAKTTAYYAHTKPGCPESERERLCDHLHDVAEGPDGRPGAAAFAGAFGAEAWGRVLGLWHDLGKYSEAFQAYLCSTQEPGGGAGPPRGKTDHSTAGAQHAFNCFQGNIGRLLAYCIAGHHGGLPDNTASDGGVSGLRDRLEKDVPSTAAAPPCLLDQPKPESPAFEWENGEEGAFQLSLFCRMLFSCLVDADYLATEAFMRPDHAAERVRHAPTPAELLPVLDAFLAGLSDGADKTTTVNEKRRFVLDACRRAADLDPGLFSLTVPTGGGKTLSSLAFALRNCFITLHGGLFEGV
ncbi:MAG: CRISPR-associated endonuclease Cas3'' [Verrucomicrobia bacterium]|nr:CRISPR-associated endonuclease Cas3'' [Verrucomicrobiota bacterium]